MVVQLIIIGIFIALIALKEPFEKERGSAPLLYFASCLAITLFVIFKDGTLLNDYDNYVELFNSSSILLEPTFQLIVAMVKSWFNSDIFYLFLIYGVIAVAVKYVAFYRLSNLLFFSLLVWLADLFIMHELTQIRAAVSTGFLLLSINSIYRKNLKQFILYGICGTLFHYSALIIFPLYFLKGDRINAKYWLGALTMCYCLAIVGVDLMSLLAYVPFEGVSSKYEFYASLQKEGDFVANIFSLLFLAKVLITVVLCRSANRIVRYNKYVYLLLKIMFLSLMGLLLFSQNLAMALRVSEFLGIVEIILFPMLFYLIRPRFAGWLVLVTIVSVLFYIRVFTFNLIRLE